MANTQRPLRVAVVDDNEHIRRLISLQLDLDERFECTAQVANGDEALRLVDRHDIDVIVLDMHMPGITGLEVLRRLRAASTRVRIIAFSADAQALRRAAKEGAAATVLKGEALDVLLAALPPPSAA